MFRNINTINTRSNRIIMALLINVLIVLVCLVFFVPSFETNDDTGLIALASGLRSAREAHIVHSNYLMGKMMTALFAAFPGLQWWSLLQFFLLFSAFFLVTYVLLKNNTGIPGLLFIAATIFFFSYEAYVRIQYTKTAGILTAAGLFLIFSGLLKKTPEKIVAFLGALLALAGSFYRIQEFVCVTAIFAALVIYGIMYCREEIRRPHRRIFAAITVGMILLLIAGGMRLYDRSQYRDNDWSAYLEFDKYRTEVIDYGVPDYDKYEKEYNAIGIDRTAYRMMKSWTFQDSEKFTAETFKKIAAFRDKKALNLSLAKSFVKNFAQGIRKEGTFFCFLAAIICWIMVGRHGRRNVISIIMMCIIIIMLQFYLFYAGRFMVNRVDVGIWFAAALILLFQSYIDHPEQDNENENDKKRVGVSILARSVSAILLSVLLGALFIYIEPWHDDMRSVANSKSSVIETERSTIEKVGADKDHLYLTKVGTLKFSDAYGVMDPVPYRMADNVYPLGGWGAATPAFKSVLDTYEVENPFRDMIGNDSVYLIDNKIDDTLDYLRRWYKADAEAELVDTINGHKIYRIK